MAGLYELDPMINVVGVVSDSSETSFPQDGTTTSEFINQADTSDFQSIVVAGELHMYSELRLAAGHVTHTASQEAALPNTQVIVGSWLQQREAQFASLDPKADPARSRVSGLARMLQARYLSSGFNSAGVNGFELDASVQLVEAAYAYEELPEEARKTVQLPELGDALEALPILRYVPKDQRQAFLAGMPSMVRDLVPPSQPEAIQEEEPLRSPNLFGKLKNLVSETLHLSRRHRQLGNAALAATVAPITEVNTQFLMGKEIIASNGKRLRLVSYYDNGDPAYDELTAKVVEGRAREYQSHNLLQPDAKLDEIRGPHVEILAVVDPETNEPVASLRKIHTTGAAMHVMPSYTKFETDAAWNPQGKALLDERTANDRPVVEIAGLWKDDAYDTDVKVALYVQAIQDSVERGELWFMGIVQAEYASLLRTYGHHVARTLGDAVTVKGEGAQSKVRLRPVMVDPDTFYDDLMDEMDDARQASNRQLEAARGMMLGTFLMGLDWSRLKPSTQDRLKELLQ